MSLAARPGTFGSRFHNHLYEALGLDYVYKAFTTQDLPAAIGGIRALGVRGCAISMPFKEACIPLLDGLAQSAAAIASVNTIVNEAGVLTGHNTDYAAVRSLIEGLGLPASTAFALRGSGGMAKALAFALRELGFARGVIVARNQTRGSALAQATGYEHRTALDAKVGLLINATPIGMSGGDEVDALAFSRDEIAAAAAVFDVVALPVETPLVRAARAAHKRVLTGADVIGLQALEQFVLYTGVRPSAAQVESARAFALG